MEFLLLVFINTKEKEKHYSILRQACWELSDQWQVFMNFEVSGLPTSFDVI